MSFDDWKKDTKKSFFAYWITNKETWIYFIACVGFSIGFPAYVFMGSEVETEITFQLLSGFAGMGIILFLISSLFTVSEQRKQDMKANKFIEDVKNGETVSARSATRKYYSILEKCLDPEDEIRVRTDIGEEVVKFKDLPDHSIPSPLELFKMIKNG